MRRRPRPEQPTPEARRRQLVCALDGLVSAGEDVAGYHLLAELRGLDPESAEILASGRPVYRNPFDAEDTP